MQNNDSRLIKAAKRTIRAEVTLIIVIIVIASWSVYALYKLAFGGPDTLLGLSLTKLTSSFDGQQTQEQKQISANSSAQLLKSLQPTPTTNSLNNKNNLQPIYSSSIAATAATPLLRNNQLNNIQSLIANQNLNRHLLALTGPVNSPVPFNAYNPSLVHHHQLTAHSGNGNGQRGAQLVAPASNLYAASHGMIGPPRGREIDYEETNAPDYGSNLDYNTSDRQAEESNRDPGESVVENSLQPDEEQDGGQVAEMDSDLGSLAETTTTVRPNIETDNTGDDQANNDEEDKPTDEGDNNDEQSKEEASSSEAKEEPSQEDEESAKETGQSIDEEVDRMTQPSLGSVSQQERPFNYKNTVQFDDSPSPLSEAVSRKQIQRPIETGTLVAQFADPHWGTEDATKKRSKKAEVQSGDLQVDHNTVKAASSPKRSRHDLSREISRNRQSRKRSKDSEKTTKTSMLKTNDPKRRSKVLIRQKRRVAKNVIRAPYEIDGFLDALNIDDFIEHASSDRSKPAGRQSRLLSTHSTPGRGVFDRDGVLETASSEAVGEKVDQRAKKRKKKLRAAPMRRSDEEEDEDGGESGEDDSGPSDESGEQEEADDSNPARTHRPRLVQQLDPRYHYITSNDTSLQDLLQRQQLLDALRNSQLPPPSLGAGAATDRLSNQSAPVNATSSQPAVGVQSSQAPQGADHQAAGSLYSVDHGLLLYPASNDEYSSKSMSKKKKKHEKKKEKKKMTVAVKKGGHKKKKHKKEEKKFMKEKKFKGAKKGKKVSKGKGGQGGKKGKKLYKDKGFKKKGFKNVYHKEEFGQKKSYFDEFRDKDFKKKWKKFDDKYNYAQMKKWQAKDVKGAKKMKDHGEKYKKYDNGKWKKKYHKHMKEHSESSKKHKKSDGF